MYFFRVYYLQSGGEGVWSQSQDLLPPAFFFSYKHAILYSRAPHLTTEDNMDIFQLFRCSFDGACKICTFQAMPRVQRFEMLRKLSKYIKAASDDVGEEDEGADIENAKIDRLLRTKAEMYVAIGDERKAIRYYEEYLSLRSDDCNAWRIYSALRYVLQETSALDICEEYMAHFPSDSEFLLGHIDWSVSKRNFLDALDACNVYLNVNPGCVVGADKKVEILLGLGEEQDAYELATKSQSTVSIAKALVSMKKYDQGKALLNKYLSANPTDVDALCWKLFFLRQTSGKDSPASKACLEVILGIDHNFERVQNRLDLIAALTKSRYIEPPPKKEVQWFEISGLIPWENIPQFFPDFAITEQDFAKNVEIIKKIRENRQKK